MEIEKGKKRKREREKERNRARSNAVNLGHKVNGFYNSVSLL